MSMTLCNIYDNALLTMHYYFILFSELYESAKEDSVGDLLDSYTMLVAAVMLYPMLIPTRFPY